MAAAGGGWSDYRRGLFTPHKIENLQLRLVLHSLSPVLSRLEAQALICDRDKRDRWTECRFHQTGRSRDPSCK